jgi:hypothetical protein
VPLPWAPSVCEAVDLSERSPCHPRSARISGATPPLTAFTLLGYFSYRSLAEGEGTVGVAAGAGTVMAALAALVAGAAWIRHRRRRRRGATERWPAVQSLTLTDGSTVDVRPIKVGDRAELAAAFARLGPVSRRRRFGPSHTSTTGSSPS